MAKRAVSNPLALAVLACLWEKPMYPYEMTTTMRERGKEDSIRLNFGSLYAVIKSLEKHGFIQVAQTEREGNRPERVVYEITEAGRTEADEWMRELIAFPVKEYPAIETGLSLLPLLAPQVAADLLERRRDLLDADLAARRSAQALTYPLPELFMIESAYRVAMMDSSPTWPPASATVRSAVSTGGTGSGSSSARDTTWPRSGNGSRQANSDRR